VLLDGIDLRLLLAFAGSRTNLDPGGHFEAGLELLGREVNEHFVVKFHKVIRMNDEERN
jgi:hypothetical protein